MINIHIFTYLISLFITCTYLISYLNNFYLVRTAVGVPCMVANDLGTTSGFYNLIQQIFLYPLNPPQTPHRNFPH